MSSRRRHAGVNVLRGGVMGIADVVPGVSGGTMALVLGIYGRFIAALAALDFRLLPLAAGVGTQAGRQAFVAHARASDLLFLFQLGAGIVVAILAGAHIVGNLIDRFPVALMALFFGLILASVRLPWSHIERPTLRAYALALIGAAVAAGVSFLPPISGPSSGLVLVGAGFLAICAMLLPGISGSAVLVLIGVYPVVLAAVRAVQLFPIALFAIGAGVGLLVASRAIRRLLRRWPAGTLAVLTGLMAGSLVRVWPWRDAAGFGLGHPVLPGAWLPLLWLLLGALVSWGLERLGAARSSVGPSALSAP